MAIETVQVIKHGVLWRTDPEYRYLVESLGGALSQVHQRDVIKSSSIRRVVTVEIPYDDKPLEIFIKHHRLTWKETLKDIWFISKARNEWKMTHLLSMIGVPTVLPLAFGERRRGKLLRESYFVSKRIHDCETVHDFVVRETEKKQPRSFLKWKWEFIRRLARLVAQIHKNGIDHRDFHAGNILIEKRGMDYQLRLLDLDRTRTYHQLSLRKRGKALAQFNMFFSLFISRADRLRFFKEYTRCDPIPWRDYEESARWIETISSKMCNRLYHRREKLCLRENKTFSKFSAPPYIGAYRKEFVRGRLVDMLKDPERVLRDSVSELLKHSSDKTVKRISLDIQGEKLDVILKSYEAYNLFGKLKDCFRSSRAIKSWVAANALLQRRIPTAIPLAYVAKRQWGMVLKSYFFYQYVPDACVLTLYLQNRFAPPLNSNERRLKKKLLTQFAQFVSYLHERSIYHGDLKSSNVLIQEKSPNEFKFYLIDLDYVKVCGCINRYQRYRNLMQLNKSILDRKIISMTDRLRFIRSYLRFSSRNKKMVRRTWHMVAYLTARHLRKTDKSLP